MKKKQLAIFLTAACLAAGTFGLSACGIGGGNSGGGGSNKSGNLTFLEKADGTYSVSKCDADASGQVDIPATFKNKAVTNIGVGAFEECASVTGVTIPVGVKSIGFGAFSACTEITEITIPNTMTEIGQEAFRNCTKLASVSVADSVTNIGINAFENTAWYNGQSDGLVCAGKVVYTYKGTPAYDSKVNFPEGVKAIAEQAFSGLDVRGKFLSIEIPEGVTHIGERAFYNNINLNTITLPDSLTSIGANAFSGTRWMTQQESGFDKAIYLGNYLIKYTGTSAENVTVKSGTRLIANSAFASRNLGTVVIPDSVQYIGRYAFANSSSGGIVISTSVTHIGEGAFAECQSVNITYRGTKEQWENIEKGEGWDNIKGEYYTVYYSDESMEQIDKN
ncbi:MAG: leucine-rich repeat domain-containing protein [Clostridiales bacterium]|nr:leucine-rich repeat domain-containing protein [Clostridiales bacterium]